MNGKLSFLTNKLDTDNQLFKARFFSSLKYIKFSFLLGILLISTVSFGQNGPAGVNSSIHFWLDASDLDGDGIVEGYGENGLLATDSIIAWIDKSQTLLTPFAPFGAYGGPTYIPSDPAFGGRAVVDFSNTNVLFADPNTPWTAAHTIFIVFKQKASPVADETAIFTNGIGITNDVSMDAHFQIGADTIGATGGNFTYHTSDDTGGAPVWNDHVFGSQSDAVTSPKIYTVTTSASDVTTYENGVLVGTSAWGNTGNQFEKYLLNINRDTSIVNECFVAELIVYQGVLPPAEIARVHDYLDCKYLGTSAGAAPGGIEPCYLSLWLKADAGVTLNSPAGNLLDWQDQGHFNFDGSTPGGARPHFIEDDNNFNPSFEFDETNDEVVDLGNSSASDELTMGTGDFTIYAVASSQAADGTLFADNRCLDENGYKIQYDNTSSTWGFEGVTFATPPAIADSSTVNIANTNTPYSLVRVQRSGANVTAITNEGGLTTGTSTTALPFSPNNGQITERWIGRQRSCGGSAQNYFDGNLSEIIVVRSNVSVDEDRKIQSYLGLKYGLSIDQATVADYRASNGSTVLWNDVIYWNNVAGIGQDNGSGLDQRISKSQEPTGIISIATDDDFANPNADGGRTSLGNGNFLLWGNNGSLASGGWTITGAPNKHVILPTVWRVSETGTVGSVYLQVDVNDTENNIPDFIGELFFVRGADLSLATPVTMTESVTDPGVWQTDVPVDFTSGDLFSFVVKNDLIVEFTESAQSSVDENPITAADFADVIASGTVNLATSFTVEASEAEATDPEDYTYTDETVSVNIGTYDKDTFDLVQPNLVQDLEIELNHYMLFAINPGDGIDVGDADTSGSTNLYLNYTITDDDSYNISIGAPTDGLEGSNDASFKIFVAGGGVNVSGGPISGNITWSGTATGGGTDYTETASFTLPMNQDTITINVPIFDDNWLEGTETVTATIAPTTAGVVAQVASATANIMDDEVTDIEVSIGSPVDANEGGNIQFTVSLPSGINNESGTALTGAITYATGTAVDGDDFAGTSSFSIDPGQNFDQVSFLALNDNLVEETETVIAQISALTMGTEASGASTSTANIYDLDTSGLTVSVTSSVTGVVEGVSDITYDITLDGGLINGTGSDITGDLNLSGTASATDDFTNVTSFSIPNGFGTTAVTVTVIDDTIAESIETVVASISGLNFGVPSALNDSASVNIIDDDAAGVIISIAPLVDTVDEDGGVPLSFTVYIEGGDINTTGANITGNISYGGGASPADYTAVPDFAILPGDSSTIINLAVTNDGNTEPTEKVTLLLPGLPVVGGSTGGYANVGAEGWIVDDDASNLTISISAPTDGQEAGDSVTYTVSLDLGATNGTGNPITGDVLYSGSAVSSDYDLVTLGSATFSIPNGGNSTTVTVPVNDDNSVEYSETLIAEIENPSIGTISSDSVATANILDNDLGSLSLSLSGGTDGEEGGNDVTFLVGMNNGYTNGLGVPLSLTLSFNGTALQGDDYSTLLPYQIPIGSNFATIPLGVIDDVSLELPETVIVTLVSATEGTISGTDFQDTAYIIDNDLGVAELQITAVDGVEMPIPHDPVFRVNFVGELQNETGSAITGNIAFGGGSATDGGVDYDAGGITTFSIPDDSTEHLITIPLFDDLILDPDETIIATISAPSQATIGSNNVATATILDDDPDRDNDGLPDIVDPDEDMYGPNFWNIDSDCDGIFDGCDVDADGDGTDDDGGIDLDGDGLDDAFYNVGGVDTDGDGIKDDCDADINGPDDNGDGLSDGMWDPEDEDDDLLPDHVDPIDGNSDSDDDGFPDGADYHIYGYLYNGCDDDDDGIHNEADVDSNPGEPDSNGNGIIDKWDSDIDPRDLINYIVSPNGDGDNDFLDIAGLQFVERYTLQIFNRWGVLVFQEVDYKNDWKGYVNEGNSMNGEELPDGTYFYVLDILKKDGNKKLVKGYIELRR